jgi:hypothetical protein
LAEHSFLLPLNKIAIKTGALGLYHPEKALNAAAKGVEREARVLAEITAGKQRVGCWKTAMRSYLLLLGADGARTLPLEISSGIRGFQGRGRLAIR